MKADYSRLNPALDQRVVELFPFEGHLWAFMRCVLFHPDYAPYITRDEQLPLAEKIVNDHENFILTVGAIYHYVACFVLKQNPGRAGVTPSVMLSAPRKTSIEDSVFRDLLAEDAPPHNTFEATSEDAFSDLLSDDTYNHAPKGDKSPSGKSGTIQQLWEKSESGTISARQLGGGRKVDPESRHPTKAELPPTDLLGGLFEELPEETQAEPIKKTGLTNLFGRNKNNLGIENTQSPCIEKTAVEPPEIPVVIADKKPRFSFGGLFRKQLEEK